MELVSQRPERVPESPVAILLADDRPAELLALSSVLAGPGVELVTAATGADALRHLLERDFAVIVLDVFMPGMNGFELAAFVRGRQRSAQTPILFLTGAGSDEEALRRAYALGAVDYLTKPVDADVLRAKVGVFVQLYEKDRRICEQAQALVEAARAHRELELAAIKLESLRRWRSLADAIPNIVATADPRGRVDFLNRRWYELTGQAEQPLDLGAWVDAVEPADLAHCRRRWRRALAGGGAFEMKMRIRAAAGEYRWHLALIQPEHDEHGERVGWLGTLTDVDDLMSASSNAALAVRIRDEFLSVASHELRTPLSALLVQLGSLERTLTESDLEDHKALRKVAAALRHTTRLTTLVDNLLDISRMASQRLHLERGEVDLAELVRDVAERFAEQARQADCELRLHMDVAMPAVGRWDRMRIEQVVTNLLSNALKYGRGGPVEISVDVEEVCARLSIRDFGIGIAPDDQGRIFERFERAVPVQHYGGLGLGLYIARTIVEAHGGRIEVESRAGGGAAFTVELPLGQGERAAVSAQGAGG